MTATESAAKSARATRPHDKFCPAYRDADAVRDDGSCDCGANIPPGKSLGAKMDAFGNGCAVTLGRTLGALCAWAVMLWIFRRDIAEAAAWFAAHVRIVP